MSHATITIRSRYCNGQPYRSIDIQVDGEPRTSFMIAGSEGYTTEAPREQEAIQNAITLWAEPRGYTAEFVSDVGDNMDILDSSTIIAALAAASSLDSARDLAIVAAHIAEQTAARDAPETYEIMWTAEDGTDEYPGCSAEEARFVNLAEAEAALQSLLDTGEWDDCDLRIEELN